MIDFINETKLFYDITDFNNEILNWKFKTNLPSSIVIGHPISSHKGQSIGDILPYTTLPEEIKKINPDATIYVPKWFFPFFEYNPYISGVNDSVSRWGSLGTWGTTVQRTCNVWGIKTFNFSPKIYYSSCNKKKKTIIICSMSKTGGKIKNINILEDIVDYLKNDFIITQIATKDDTLIRNVHSYIFNIPINKLIETISSFEYYIGAQNSIYHLSKALNLKVITLLPENINPFFVMLPFLTQINHLELEMLSNEERYRSIKWKQKIIKLGLDPNDSHHVGWLYPDSVHLTTNLSSKINNIRCPIASPENVKLAMFDKLFPFNNPILFDFNNYSNLWL